MPSLSFCHKFKKWNAETFKVNQNSNCIAVKLLYFRNSHKKTLLNEELSYKCSVCNELFWSIAERSVHIAENHKEASENLEKCQICAHISPNRHALRRHFQRMHPNETLVDNMEFKCDECGEIFQQKSQLTSHVKLEHCPKTSVYQCTICSDQFTNKKSLSKHMMEHKKEESKEVNTKYTCQICCRDFRSRKALKTHESFSHSEKTRKGFLCKVCNKVLETASDRTLHYKVQTGFLEILRKLNLNFRLIIQTAIHSCAVFVAKGLSPKIVFTIIELFTIRRTKPTHVNIVAKSLTEEIPSMNTC